MKKLISILVVSLLSLPVLASSPGVCQEYSYSYVKVMHDKVLADIGVIQGYYEDVDVKLTQESINSGYENAYKMTYTFSITGGNDEGEWWVSEYVVTSQAYYDNGDEPQCYLQSMDYKGIVDEGNEYSYKPIYSMEDLVGVAQRTLEKKCGHEFTQEELNQVVPEDVDEDYDYIVYVVDFASKGSVVVSLYGDADNPEVSIDEYFCSN